MPEVVGGIECPGFDVEAFKAECRAPVYPGLINRWILVRTDADNASLVEVKDNAKAQLKHWFWPSDMGSIDNIEIGEPLRGSLGSYRPQGIVKRSNQCAQTMTVRAKTPWFVPVSFAYRGSADSIPWPAWKDTFMGDWCPIAADWILFLVESPGSDAPPEERGWLPKLPDMPELPSAPDITKAAREGIAIGTVLVLLGVGGFVLWSTRKERVYVSAE